MSSSAVLGNLKPCNLAQAASAQRQKARQIERTHAPGCVMQTIAGDPSGLPLQSSSIDFQTFEGLYLNLIWVSSKCGMKS